MQNSPRAMTEERSIRVPRPSKPIGRRSDLHLFWSASVTPEWDLGKRAPSLQPEQWAPKYARLDAADGKPLIAPQGHHVRNCCWKNPPTPVAVILPTRTTPYQSCVPALYLNPAGIDSHPLRNRISLHTKPNCPAPSLQLLPQPLETHSASRTQFSQMRHHPLPWPAPSERFPPAPSTCGPPHHSAAASSARKSALLLPVRRLSKPILSQLSREKRG